MLYDCVSILRMTHANSEACESFTSQMSNQRFDSVMASCGAFFANSYFSGRQIKIITDDINIIETDLVIIGNGSHCFSAVIHIGQRFDKKNLFPVDNNSCCFRLHRFFPCRNIPAFCQNINDIKPHIMAGVFIFLARISESC